MRSCAVNAVWKKPERSDEEDMVAEEDMTQKENHETTDPLQGQSNCQPDEIKVDDRIVHDQSTRLNDDKEAVTIDGEVMGNDAPGESTYYREGGELFAEDVVSIFLCCRR